MAGFRKDERELRRRGVGGRRANRMLASFVGVATHDAPLAAAAMEILAKAGTPFEQEFVFPLPIEPALEEGKRYAAKARVYLPYGSAWLPYSLKRAINNPIMLYWLARDALLGRTYKVPEEVVA